MCKVVVFLIKTIVFWRSRRRPRRKILKSLFREFKQQRSWAKHVNWRWAFFFLLSLNATIFVLPSVLILIEIIFPKHCSISRLKSAKSQLPVDVRRCYLNTLLICYTCLHDEEDMVIYGIAVLSFCFYKWISIIFQFFLRYWVIRNPNVPLRDGRADTGIILSP